MPTADPVPPRLRAELDALRNDLEALRTNHPVRDPVPFKEYEVAFSFPATPDTTLVSPPYHFRHPYGYINELRLSAQTVGSGQTTINVMVNDVVQTSITHDAASDDHHALEDDLMVELVEWDRITVQASAVGGSISGISLQVVIRVPTEGE